MHVAAAADGTRLVLDDPLDVPVTDGIERPITATVLPPAVGRTWVRWTYRAPTVAWDSGVWFLSLLAAGTLRHEFDIARIDMRLLGYLVLLAVLSQIAIGLVLHLYDGRLCSGSIDDAVHVAGGFVLTGVVVFAANLLTDPQLSPRSVPILAVPIAVLLATGARLAVRLHRERVGPDRRQLRRVVVLGAGSDGQHLVRSMRADPWRGYRPVALLDDDPALRRRRISGVAVQGTGADIAAAAQRARADLLVITGVYACGERLTELTSAAARAGLGVSVVPPLAELLRPAPSAVVDDLHLDGRLPVGAVSEGDDPARTARDRAQRALDLVLCLLAVPVVLPVLVVVAVALRLTGAPVLYRATRVGRHGVAFTMYKFATMRPGDGGPRVTREGDPRITPVGRWLRASKLNELPQVLNVLKGEMSIVGPRPEDPRYVVAYSEDQRQALAVRPGMTSLAFLHFGDEQALIERAEPADIETYYLREVLPDKLRVELEYVRNRSLLGDLRIIALTLTRLLS